MNATMLIIRRDGVTPPYTLWVTRGDESWGDVFYTLDEALDAAMTKARGCPNWTLRYTEGAGVPADDQR